MKSSQKTKTKKEALEVMSVLQNTLGTVPPQIYSTFITTGAKENASKKQTTRSANSFI